VILAVIYEMFFGGVSDFISRSTLASLPKLHERV
jgi:hypothetical protein